MTGSNSIRLPPCIPAELGVASDVTAQCTHAASADTGWTYRGNLKIRAKVCLQRGFRRRACKAGQSFSRFEADVSIVEDQHGEPRGASRETNRVAAAAFASDGEPTTGE